jgi:hypothetical protein
MEKNYVEMFEKCVRIYREHEKVARNTFECFMGEFDRYARGSLSASIVPGKKEGELGATMPKEFFEILEVQRIVIQKIEDAGLRIVSVDKKEETVYIRVKIGEADTFMNTIEGDDR